MAMAHKIFDSKLKAAQEAEKRLAQKLERCKKDLRTALLTEDDSRGLALQQAISRLQPEYELAVAKVEAIESTRSEAEQEERQARNSLEAALGQVRRLNNSLPGAYKNWLQELEAVAAKGEEFMAQYQTLKDKDTEARYLSELIGEVIDLPPRYRMNISSLPALGQRIRVLAQKAGSPNVAVKWAHRFAELRREGNRQAKLERLREEEAKGLRHAGQAFNY
jgi:hypothetical protein